MIKVNEKINCSPMSFWLYQKQGLFSPDKIEQRGTRTFPKYSEETVEKIIDIIRNKRTRKAMRTVKLNAGKLDDIHS
jgi:hypothetical protein